MGQFSIKKKGKFRWELECIVIQKNLYAT